MFLQSFRDRDEGPDEHSRVPAILTAIDIFQCFVEIRLLFELFGPMKHGLVTLDTRRRRQGLAYFDVTIGGLRSFRRNSNSDDSLSPAGQVTGVGQNLLK